MPRTITNAAVDDLPIHFDKKRMIPVWSKRMKSRVAVAVVTAKGVVFVNVACTCSSYYCSTWRAMAVVVPDDGKTVNLHGDRMILAHVGHHVHDDRNLLTSGSAEIGAKNVRRRRKRFAPIPLDDSTLAVYGNAVEVRTATTRVVDVRDGTLKKRGWSTCVLQLEEVCKTVVSCDDLLPLFLVPDHVHSRSEVACCANLFCYHHHSDYHRVIRDVLETLNLRFVKRQLLNSALHGRYLLRRHLVHPLMRAHL